MAINVLHVTYDMRIGGTEMVIKNIINGFLVAPSDIRSWVFCIEKPIGPWGESLRENGIIIESHGRRPGFDWSLVAAIRRAVVKHGINILHCHQYSPWVYGLIASLGTPARVIFTEHGRFYPDSSSWKRLVLNPWFARLTDAITAISNATKRALIDHEAIRKEKIRVVYNGIAPLQPDQEQVREIRSSFGLGRELFLFGTVARFDPIKNQSLMIRAFARVASRQSHARLLMVGDGVERTRLQELVEELGIEKRVRFVGYVTDPGDMIAALDVFLLSSLSEGTSMTLLEAMSLGVPCIVTDAGGNAEIITEGKNGLVTPNQDGKAFSEAMNRLLEDKKLCQSLSAGARQIFQDKFAAEHMLKEYGSLYTQVANGC